VPTASDGTAEGIGQWTYLPLHRTRQYEFRIVARAIQPCALNLRIAPADAQDAAGTARIALRCDWQTISGRIDLPRGSPAEALYQFALTATRPAHFVLDRVLLYPSDHVGGADPDVIGMLRDTRLPLLRWPGGNFVSGYRWRDGVGPIDTRPTVANPAWEGLEPNLFGTDEFVSFCRAVGCQPMICVNAGDGCAEEAAAWVEYCNGATDTPMGRLRASNGHPEPYGVTYWEIGNEIYGSWQVGWTTPAGNVDRYQRFCAAMLAVDPSVRLIGCGYGNRPDSEWNKCLIDGAGRTLHCISDHILTGGSVDAETDPIELYHAFMGYPTALEGRYRGLRDQMHAAGIDRPHLAITELQLFSHFQGEARLDGKLSPTRMPRPDTIAEALYLTAIIHTCIRLGDFVEMLTHSATVNHGGGLRKERERVYANPVHYAHALGSMLAEGTPVAVRLSCETFSTHRSFSHIPPLADVPVLDAMAVLSTANELVLMLVHRGAQCGSIELEITLQGYQAQSQADIATLAGETWYDRNTPSDPVKITPQHAKAKVSAGSRLSLTLAPYSLTRVILRAD
jgi:alpha-N-arabinofuranosidase